MRSSRNYSLEAFLAKASKDYAKTHREMEAAAAPKGAHRSKDVFNHSKGSSGPEHPHR